MNIFTYFLRARNGKLAGDKIILCVYDDEDFHVYLLMQRCICAGVRMRFNFYGANGIVVPSAVRTRSMRVISKPWLLPIPPLFIQRK